MSFPLDNLQPLTAHRAMLGWLGDRPEQTIRDQVAAMLAQQVTGTRLKWIRVIGEPEFLTDGDLQRLSSDAVMGARLRELAG